ncbi:hypothetical protein HN51_017862 [Arachis hypogaea]|uniref:WEB family protein n=2 Tax=Arachis TaxID=3817 RepID=A0A445BRD6_ARAHY|nr:WEB family protein At1g75720-like [Arachis duranensis]XP_025612314.1 WEB family protein At1g75720 [Arachis hypogaea]QHO29385.1 WEB family protein [Arachis hypogaea]RYR41243.1 hypothetical protein Ahy_A08g037645 [Arachis hypogaea]
MMKNREEGVTAVRNAEIDTRAPFTSVKEAVSLFGDKVLAGHVYANTTYLKHQSGEKESYWKIGEVAAELKETRENLERAREESMLMAHCLSSLQEELERTKRELQQLKQMSETEKHVDVHPPADDEIEEDVKFVENLTTFQVKSSRFEDEFQKKRYVTFANPPSESHHHHHHHVMLQPPPEKLERHPSLRRNTKKKSFIPLIGAIFSRKNPTQH